MSPANLRSLVYRRSRNCRMPYIADFIGGNRKYTLVASFSRIPEGHMEPGI